MAGSGRPKSKRSRGAPKAGRRRTHQHTSTSVLGNDPFEHGAAERAPAQPVVLAPLLATEAAQAGRAPVDQRSAEPLAQVAAAAATPKVSPPGPRVPEPEATVSGPEPVSEATVAAEPVFVPAPPAPSLEPPFVPAAGSVETVRLRLAALESRVESAAVSATSRLRELAGQEASGQHARDLVRAVVAMLPAVRERLSAVAALGAVFTGSGELDAYGMDRDLARRASPVLEFLYASWWRVAARSIENVPARGPVVVVANHGGVLPWDALVLRLALQRDHPAHRELRPLLDERALAMPVAGSAARRLGAVSAVPEHAVRLLEAGMAVGVFPEGSRGSTRSWPDRYRVQRFGRGGFAKLALRTGAAIVPCAIVGSEETALPVARAGWLSSALGMPFLRSPPSLPLASLGVLPLPARWSLRFGPALDTTVAGPDAAADAARVLELTERTRDSLQQMLDEDVGARRSVFL